jgi:hypothetical protein
MKNSAGQRAGQFKIMNLKNKLHLCFGFSILKNRMHSMAFTHCVLARERALAGLRNLLSTFHHLEVVN